MSINMERTKLHQALALDGISRLPNFLNRTHMRGFVPFGAAKDADNPIYSDPTGQDIHWPFVVKYWDTYYLLYCLAGATAGRKILVATSSDGKNFTFQKVIDIGGYSVEPQSVVRVGNEFWIYLAFMETSGDPWECGLTKTTDLLDETKYSSPVKVLSVGSPGAWDESYATDPRVVYWRGKFWLYYIGHAGTWDTVGTGLAKSVDGETFTKVNGKLIGNGGAGSWDEDRHCICSIVPTISGITYVAYGIDSGSELRNFLVVSEDGENFTRWYKELISKGSTYDDLEAIVQTIFNIDRDLVLYYQAKRSSGSPAKTLCRAIIEDFF